MKWCVHGIHGKKPDYPSEVYDATGVEHTFVVFCDDETGEIRAYLPDADGSHRIKTVFVPAPLRIVPLSRSSPVICGRAQ